MIKRFSEVRSIELKGSHTLPNSILSLFPLVKLYRDAWSGALLRSSRWDSRLRFLINFCFFFMVIDRIDGLGFVSFDFWIMVLVLFLSWVSDEPKNVLQKTYWLRRFFRLWGVNHMAFLQKLPRKDWLSLVTTSLKRKRWYLLLQFPSSIFYFQDNYSGKIYIFLDFWVFLIVFVFFSWLTGFETYFLEAALSLYLYNIR